MSDKDAEIAREEARERDVLRGKLANVLSNAINYPSKVQPHILGQDMGPLISEVAEAIRKAGFTRQSPASTTAADAWDEGFRAGKDPIRYGHPEFYSWDVADNTYYVKPGVQPRRLNPYRVAVPEGDGGK